MDFSNTFTAFSTKFWTSSTERLQEITDIADDVLLAIGIILLGWILGSAVKAGIMKIAEKLRVAQLSKKVGLTHLLEKANIKMSPSRLIAEFLKGYIIVIFLIGAANILGFLQISEFLDSVITYIPDVLIALVIVLLGMRVAMTTSAILENTLRVTYSQAAKTLALTARYIIVAFAILAALFELKIAPELIQVLFIGFISMIALAGGLAFGLGGKEVVREFLEDLKHAETEEKGK